MNARAPAEQPRPASRSRRRGARQAADGEEPIPGLATDVLAERYKLGKELTRGRCGPIVGARDLLLERDVVLKLLRFGDELEVTRALRAARAASLVADEHTVPVLDVDQVEGVAFVALPLYQARPLSETLVATAPRSAWALAIADDVLRGLAAIHAAGAVHRDVSADNVLLLADGSARLTSAGLAAAAADETLGLRVDDAISSAAHALAHPDQREDVAAAAHLLRQLLHRSLVPPVERVLDVASSEQPERRYRDAGELRSALVAAGLGRGTWEDAEPMGGAKVDVQAMPATTQLPAVTVDSSQVRGRRLGVGAVLAVAVLVLVFLLLRGGGEEEPAPAEPEPTVAEEVEEREETTTEAASTLGDVIPGIDAPLLPAADATPTLEQVLAAAEDADLGLAGANVIERLQQRATLEGDELAAETAELFGTAAVAVASDAAWADVATDVADHLRPELTVESLLALAGRDPALLDPFFTRLVSGLEGLVPLTGQERADAAEALLPDLELAATEGILSPALAAATAEVLDQAQTVAPATEVPPQG